MKDKIYRVWAEYDIQLIKYLTANRRGFFRDKFDSALSHAVTIIINEICVLIRDGK